MPIFFVLEIEEGGGVTDTLQGTLSSVEAELEGMHPGDVRLIKCVEKSATYKSRTLGGPFWRHAPNYPD